MILRYQCCAGGVIIPSILELEIHKMYPDEVEAENIPPGMKRRVYL